MKESESQRLGRDPSSRSRSRSRSSGSHRGARLVWQARTPHIRVGGADGDPGTGGDPRPIWTTPSSVFMQKLPGYSDSNALRLASPRRPSKRQSAGCSRCSRRQAPSTLAGGAGRMRWTCAAEDAVGCDAAGAVQPGTCAVPSNHPNFCFPSQATLLEAGDHAKPPNIVRSDALREIRILAACR